MRPNLAIAAVILTLVSHAAAPDPLNGDWKLSAKAHPGKGPLTDFLHIELDDSRVVVLHKGIDGKGQPLQWTIRADCTGQLSGVVDTPGVNMVRCWHSDSHTLLMKLFRDTVATGYWNAEVARNGRSLKVTSTALDEAGRETKAVDLFEKQ
jgi:hypothetical protein